MTWREGQGAKESFEVRIISYFSFFSGFDDVIRLG